MPPKPQRMLEREAGEILTPKEVAEILKMTERTVVRHLMNGIIPGKKIGVVWRVRRDILERYMEDEGQKQAA